MCWKPREFIMRENQDLLHEKCMQRARGLESNCIALWAVKIERLRVRCILLYSFLCLGAEWVWVVETHRNAAFPDSRLGYKLSSGFADYFQVSFRLCNVPWLPESTVTHYQFYFTPHFSSLAAIALMFIYKKVSKQEKPNKLQILIIFFPAWEGAIPFPSQAIF